MSTNAHSEQNETAAASASEHGLAWYALSVRTRHEKSVARTLESKGYETFVPVYTRPGERRTGKQRSAELPLFAGVVFSRFDIHKRLPVLVTPGVTQILGSEPAAIDDNEIDSLRIATQQSLDVCPFPFLDGGHKVQITDGPLCGAEGVVVHVKGTVRVILSVARLERSVMVELGNSNSSISESARTNGVPHRL